MADVTAINAAIRAGIPLAAGFIETSDAVSSARDSGKWGVYTVAGTITNSNNVISKVLRLAEQGLRFGRLGHLTSSRVKQARHG